MNTLEAAKPVNVTSFIYLVLLISQPNSGLSLSHSEVTLSC